LLILTVLLHNEAISELQKAAAANPRYTPAIAALKNVQ
jgi:hypothetical protein